MLCKLKSSKGKYSYENESEMNSKKNRSKKSEEVEKNS